MKLGFLLGVFLLLSFSTTSVSAQAISGRVISKATKEGVAFANITIPSLASRSRKVGVNADENGRFLMALRSLPIIIEITAVGYKGLRFEVTTENFSREIVIELEEAAQQLDAVIISSEKMTVQELRAPVEISKLSLSEIQNTPSFNFYDAIGNLKGVDVTTQSVVLNSVNTRGFNSTTNQRFKQFTDGIDNQAPGLSFSLGNIIGPNPLDIESIELIPGPGSAVYGPSTFNGVLDMKTKNPFDYQGLSFTAKGASISQDKDQSQFITLGENFISELAGRYAFAIKDKVGLKVAGSVLRGVDFRASNYDNIGPGDSFDRIYSLDNQGINGVNIYGDDRASFVIVPQGFTFSEGAVLPNGIDTAFFVTRRGYQEEDLVNYQAENIKFNAELQIKLTENLLLSAASFYGRADAMITGDDRIALRNFEIRQHKAEISGKNFLIRGYRSSQSSGQTYNVGLLAEHLIQRAKPDAIWFQQYTALYNTGLRSLIQARSMADTGFPASIYMNRLDPGTPEFEAMKAEIIQSRVPGVGAAIFDRSALSNIEAKLDLKEKQSFFEDLQVGGSYRFYDPESAGTIFTDSIGYDVTNFEYGFFTEVSKSLDSLTELSASIRYDKNENFEGKFSQRLSVVRTHKERHYFRLSLQRGFRLPNVREQFFNQDFGEKRIIGGLRQVTDPYDLHGNAITVDALDRYNQRITDIIAEGSIKLDATKIDNLDIISEGVIQEGQFSGIKPERITSFELGYRTLIENKKFIEITFYRNYYKNFIGNLRVVKPRTSPSIDLLRAAEQANNLGSSDLIFVTDNSDRPIVSQGLELLYDVSGNSGTYFTINATFANIIQQSDDPLTPGFNTPPFKFNFKVGDETVVENFGVELTWRSRSAFDWESPFLDGRVDGFSTLDVQFTFKIPSLNSLLRIGGNNMIGIKQFNSFGGPEIGGFYYLNFTYDPFQSR